MSKYIVVPVANIFTLETRQKLSTLVGKTVEDIEKHFGSGLLSSTGKKITLKILAKDSEGFYVDNGCGGIEFSAGAIKKASEIGKCTILKVIPGIDAIETDNDITAAIIVAIDYDGDWDLSDIDTPLARVLYTADSRRKNLVTQSISPKSLIVYGEMGDVDLSSRY